MIFVLAELYRWVNGLNGRKPTPEELVKVYEEHLKKLRDPEGEMLATEEEIEEALNRYSDGDCDIEVDRDAFASRTDDGVWVQGWLWVPKDDDDDKEGE